VRPVCVTSWVETQKRTGPTLLKKRPQTMKQDLIPVHLRLQTKEFTHKLRMSNNNPYRTKRKSTSHEQETNKHATKTPPEEDSKISFEEESKISASKSSSFEDVVPKYSSSLYNLSLPEIEAILSMKKMKGGDKESAPQYVRCKECGMTIEKDFAEDHTCPANHQLKMAAVEFKTSVDYNSEDEIKAASKSIKMNDLQTEDGQMYAEATSHSKRHENRRQSMLSKITDVCVDLKDELGNLSELVEDTNDPGTYIPKALVVLGGNESMYKCSCQIILRNNNEKHS